MRSYEEFAFIYDQLMNDVDYNNWYKYIEDIFKHHDSNPKTILEMGCGTGSFTKFLCENGYDVTCFDISEDMLSIAYNKLKGFKNVKILSQDMTRFSLDKKYDAIISICDSVNYITLYEDLNKVFENAYNHLNDNGIFIFDINSHYKLSKVIGNNIFLNENEDVYYVWDNSYDEEDRLCYFYLTFFIKDKELYKRFDEEHLQKAYYEEEVHSALKQAGFKNIYCYDAFTFNKGNSYSERQNFVAKK